MVARGSTSDWKTEGRESYASRPPGSTVFELLGPRRNDMTASLVDAVSLGAKVEPPTVVELQEYDRHLCLDMARSLGPFAANVHNSS
jgi:hypothetical protein